MSFPVLLAAIPEAPPASLLAWDEAILDAVEDGEWESALWFWEAPQPFVVVGYGQKVDREVDREACDQLGVPVLRRCSGGGAVVQGPGCLSYGLALRMDLAPELATIPGANQWIMNRQRNAIAALLGSQPDRVAIQGHTDLTIDGRKFSGNSQRRRRLALLFHGTFLLNFDLNLIGRLLRFPSAQPDYRLSRGHADFVVNLGLPRNQVEAAIHAEWDAHEPATLLSSNRHDALFAERYSIADWHLKR